MTPITERNQAMEFITHVGIDVSDQVRSQAFYSELLGLRCQVARAQYTFFQPLTNGLTFYIQRVPEKKTSKTQVHIDVSVKHLPAALARVEDLGGKRLGSFSEWQGSWTVITDPDGNELCLAQA